MIISKPHDFGFVHIPKCAGSTIRHQLRDIDDLNGKFYHTITLPDLGRINANHVPLGVLEEYFPDDLAALRDVTSYAILRAPKERFISGVAQYLRAHVCEPAELSVEGILAETEKIITGLKNDPDQRGIRNTVFFRQSDYVYLHGKQVIDYLFTMDNLAQFFDRLEAQHGLSLEREAVWNPTVTYRIPGSSNRMHRLKDAARRILPVGAYIRLRDVSVRLLTTKGVPQLEAALTASTDIQVFIDTHYREDAALYRRVQAGEMDAA